MSALHHLGMREKIEPLARSAATAVEDSLPNARRTGDSALAAQAAHGDRNAACEYSGLPEESGAFHSLLEHASTYAFFLLLAAALYLSFGRLAGGGRLWLVVFALPLGMLAGDFISGLTHWLADTYGSERTPLVGANFIKWFRLHHVYPKDICTHGFITTNGNTCILAAPLVGFCLPFVWDEEVSAMRAFTVLTTVLTAATTVATNQFHKWAHTDVPPRVARLLQSAHLILRPQHHSQHHTAPHLTDYCIANGWLNPLLEKIRFFGVLERALLKLGIRRANATEEGRRLDE
jgi:ubiquitin-conjugating enzyme E2 variant